ncbi:MAG: ABC transporter substrate-binding protein, partial [Pseudomonadota bacterium]
MKRTCATLIINLLLCLVWQPSPAPAAEPVKIGLILPITGPAAAYGDMALAGIKLAQADRPEVLGRPVKLILNDNKSDKVESTNAANRLIQRDKVAAIIGALSSSPTLAAAPIAEAAGIPLVSGWATNPLVTKGRRFVFRTCFIDPFQGGVAANFAFKDLKARSAAVMMDVSRDYSVGLGSFFIRSFKK